FRVFWTMPAVKYDLLRWTILLGLPIALVVYVLCGSRAQRVTRLFDLVWPLGLALVAVRVIEQSPLHRFSFAWVREQYPIEDARLVAVLGGLGLVVLAFAIVEHPVRFALGLGALFLASGPVGDGRKVLFKERNFFGVSKVEVVQVES